MTMQIAVVQMTSTNKVADNLAHVRTAIASAASAGAHFVVLPENFAAFGSREYASLAAAEGDTLDGPIVTQLCQMALQHRIWLCAGTLPLLTGNDPRPATATLIISPEGRVTSRYHKIHLFDAQVADRQGQYQESASYAPGRGLCVIDTVFGRIGVAVCYDLRFPEMFLAYRKLGVSLLVIPSAFTHATGAAHWETLIRCRAIENGYFIAAANQGGVHWNNRETWGHSMVVDPWGKVLHESGIEPDVGLASIDMSHSHRMRQAIPTQWHREQRLARSRAW